MQSEGALESARAYLWSDGMYRTSPEPVSQMSGAADGEPDLFAWSMRIHRCVRDGGDLPELLRLLLASRRRAEAPRRVCSNGPCRYWEREYDHCRNGSPDADVSTGSCDAWEPVAPPRAALVPQEPAR